MVGCRRVQGVIYEEFKVKNIKKYVLENRRRTEWYNQSRGFMISLQRLDKKCDGCGCDPCDCNWGN
jgi:hypothetical protein